MEGGFEMVIGIFGGLWEGGCCFLGNIQHGGQTASCLSMAACGLPPFIRISCRLKCSGYGWKRGFSRGFSGRFSRGFL